MLALTENVFRNNVKYPLFSDFFTKKKFNRKSKKHALSVLSNTN